LAKSEESNLPEGYQDIIGGDAPIWYNETVTIINFQ
jgi:hypothetical protein